MVPAEAYRRAERFLLANAQKYVLNASVAPNWIGEEDRFWYRRALTGGGKRFVIVNAATGNREPSFDHALIAHELARLDGEDEHTETTLPFDTFTFNSEGGIDFAVGEAFYSCTAERCAASEPPALPFTPLETPSPDGRWAAYHKDHNLWVRSADGEAHIQLTTNGEDGWGYATQLGTSVSYISIERLQGGHAPQVKWSPDSTKLLTQRVDEREVKQLSIVEHAPEDGSLRPRTHTMRYAFARDEVKPRGRFVVFDIPSGARTDIGYPDIELTYAALTGPESREVWWREDGRGFGFVHRFPFARGYSVNRVDLETGEITVEFERASERTSSPGIATPLPPQVVDFADGSIVWFSDERRLRASLPQGRGRQRCPDHRRGVERRWDRPRGPRSGAPLFPRLAAGSGGQSLPSLRLRRRCGRVGFPENHRQCSAITARSWACSPAGPRSRRAATIW